MAENCPEVLVGAGTIVNVEQAKLAVEMGAKYKADGTLNAIYLADEICGSSPATTSVLSTTYEKSELIPHRECVRIFHFYQGYFLLMFIPGGFFILLVSLLFAHSIPDRSPATMIAENH